jgi:mono/diheme cytochrome c family protein
MKRTWGWVGGAAALLSAAAIFFVLNTQLSEVSAQGRKTKPNAAVIGDLYKTNCARCHGADGRGDTPLGEQYNAPDFTAPQWWRQKTASRGKMVSVVTSGKDDMPAFYKKLTRSQIEQLVDYVRRFRKTN